MADELPRYLEELTIPKLKTAAQTLNVDVSSCKHKKDYIDALAVSGVTERQVKEALALAEQQDEMAATKAEIESIAEKGPGARELPADEYTEIERNIDGTLLVRPSLFDIDSHMEHTWDRMLMGDFREAMRLNQDVRAKMLDRLSSLQIYSSAISIRAAETIMANIASSGGKVDSRLKTALAEAKKAFVEGSPKKREETLEELETLTLKMFDAFFEENTKAEEELRTLLADYESFGTQTQDSRRILEIAEQARRSFNVSEYARLVTQAKDSADYARAARERDIRRALDMAEAAVAEAKEVGGQFAVGDKELGEAKDAIQKKAFRRAVELLSSVEGAADRAHEERIRNNDVRAAQVSKVSTAIANWGPALEEAASYGLDAQEGLLFVRSAKTALDRRDIVTAAKLARRLDQVSGPIGEELDRKRIELGVAAKIEGAKCGKCGKEALYSFPNDVRKCTKCGHSFTLTPPAPRRGPQEHIESPVSKSVRQEESESESGGRQQDKK